MESKYHECQAVNRAENISIEKLMDIGFGYSGMIKKATRDMELNTVRIVAKN